MTATLPPAIRRRFAEILVGDLMTIDPFVVPADAPIEDAERLLADHHVSGLPVVDEDGRLVGVISRTDLTANGSPSVSALLRGRPTGLRVGELMSTPPVTVPMAATLVEAARIMRDERIHRVVVTDDDARPIGVVAASDYVALVAEG